MELLLNKVCGQPAALPVAVRRCGPADAAVFYALQNEVRAAMPHPEQFVPDTQENITAYLAHDLCLGVFDGERLGAYFILRYCGQSEHNYAAFLGIPQAEWDHWANADSAVVHPDWRGNGLQRKLLEAASQDQDFHACSMCFHCFSIQILRNPECMEKSNWYSDGRFLYRTVLDKARIT